MRLDSLLAELNPLLSGAEHEIIWLASHFLQISKSAVRQNRDYDVSPAQEQQLRAAVACRLSGQPLQYITGVQPFWDFDLIVTPDVLIPRWDSETVIEQALTLLPQGQKLEVCDVCTGSGAYALALKQERPQINITACDISESALNVARQNAAKYNLNIDFRQGNLLNALIPGTKFDLIVSNPPYIRNNAILPADVRQEPAIALFGGTDGLDFYRRLAGTAGAYLNPGGYLLLETGADQKAAVSGLLQQHGFINITAGKDLAGYDRWVQGVWKGE
ncbi:MAG TPA: peptide chain release factor N(5)-glutamine methyltransferase [Candidatus Avidehalobacter gallistercoris]|uniref:Release factor glutamine methyltransferase n=1 Tax=Candidatus Avidehalobacter gallistercoris TaxID=2840694 RepID=A0A9D1HJP0_9FIRM|nr:peptide chain release factor N(5)-glutamine methyltransferase [Candidatus Avidehalobacter gallistercoris]